LAGAGISEEDVKRIEELFGKKFENVGNCRSVKLENLRTNGKISLEIFSEESKNYLVSVYTSNSHLQLQDCTRAIISNMLEEVIFISETSTHISGLIISKQGDCSMYAGVDRNLFSKDFTELSSEKLLAAVALSVAESGD
jgi:hypothetical protein